MYCTLCEREHGKRCPTADRIQQSERHAELPDRTDPTSVEAWLED